MLTLITKDQKSGKVFCAVVVLHTGYQQIPFLLEIRVVMPIASNSAPKSRNRRKSVRRLSTAGRRRKARINPRKLEVAAWNKALNILAKGGKESRFIRMIYADLSRVLSTVHTWVQADPGQRPVPAWSANIKKRHRFLYKTFMEDCVLSFGPLPARIAGKSLAALSSQSAFDTARRHLLTSFGTNIKTNTWRLRRRQEADWYLDLRVLQGNERPEKVEEAIDLVKAAFPNADITVTTCPVSALASCFSCIPRQLWCGILGYCLHITRVDTSLPGNCEDFCAKHLPGLAKRVAASLFRLKPCPTLSKPGLFFKILPIGQFVKRRASLHPVSEPQSAPATANAGGRARAITSSNSQEQQQQTTNHTPCDKSTTIEARKPQSHRQRAQNEDGALTRPITAGPAAAHAVTPLSETGKRKRKPRTDSSSGHRNRLKRGVASLRALVSRFSPRQLRPASAAVRGDGSDCLSHRSDSSGYDILASDSGSDDDLRTPKVPAARHRQPPHRAAHGEPSLLALASRARAPEPGGSRT